MNSDQNPPKKRGCFFYGCLSMIVLSLVAVLLIYLGFRYVGRVADEYTDSKPATIETVEISPARLEALQKRLAAFREVLDAQKVSEELTLSADDLNALIANEPGLKDLRNKLFIIIEGDRIKGKVSIPLDKFPVLKLKGRFLNGTATFKASLENGSLLVMLDDLEVKGKPLPAQFLSPMKKQNLARDAQQDPKAAQAIQKFDTIRIQDGAVIVKNKVK